MKKIRISLVLAILLASVLACLGSSEQITVNDTSGVQNGEESGSDDVSGDTEPPASSATQPGETEPSESGESEPAPEEPTISLEVTTVNWYINSIDTMYMIGMVENTGNVDLEYVEVIANLRDADGSLVATESSYIEFDVLPAGQSSPFSVIFFNNPGEWDTYEILAQGDEARYRDTYTDFEILSSKGSVPSFGDYEIVGEISNIGETDAEFVEVIAVLYDSDGNILAVDSTYTELDIVKAGGTSPFSILVLGKADGEIASYDLYVQGNPAD